MHLHPHEDLLTVNAGVVIKGLRAIASTAAKASHMNKFCNEPTLLSDYIGVFQPLQYMVKIWVMRDAASSVQPFLGGGMRGREDDYKSFT